MLSIELERPGDALLEADRGCPAELVPNPREIGVVVADVDCSSIGGERNEPEASAAVDVDQELRQLERG